MSLQALDVIKIYDVNIDPANWKRVVCVCPLENLFYRINSYDDHPISVFLPLEPNHRAFLKWDSYLECGKYPLELDNYTIEKALASNGGVPLGRVHASHCQAICDAVRMQSTIPKATKKLIHIALGCAF